MDILKEEDFDGILWDANDDVVEKEISSELGDEGQHQHHDEENDGIKKNEGQHQMNKVSTLTNLSDLQSKMLTVDPTRTLLDLSSQRTFAPIDIDDTLEHPFLNSFVSTLAEKSSSQDAANNVLNASTGLPLFASTSSSSNCTNKALNVTHLAESTTSTTQSRLPSTTTGLMNNEYEKMMLQPNYLAADSALLLTQQIQQTDPNLSQPNLVGNKWNIAQTANTMPSNIIASTNASTTASTTTSSQPAQVTQNSNTTQHVSNLQSNYIKDIGSMSNNANQSKPKSKSKKSRTYKEKNKVRSDKAQVPPFFLFDAPVELRHNYMKAQQAHNISANIQDSNAFHYGLAINALQPMIKYKDNRVRSLTMLNSVDDVVNPRGKQVELLDARQKKSKKGNDRNEREQQRAQKITELIDKLRLTMVQAGWKVEMKSKYQILST